MSKLKRTTAILSVMLIGALMLAACSGSNNDKNAEPTKAPAATEAPKESALPEGQITAEPLELKIHLHYDDTRVFDDTWKTFKYAADKTNISLKGTASATATSSDEVFNLMLASGTLPDIIHGKKDKLNQAGIDGALIPLDELIEEHAPNIKAFFEKNEWARKGSLNSDGKLYYIPYVMDGEASMGFFIRQDWLDTLKLPVPKTIDEFYNTLVAIRDGDPNGNGKKDEIPYFNRNMLGGIELAQLFGANSDWYEKDGVIQFGKFAPEYKTAMTNISKWYAEGLIDKEIFTRGGKSRDILLGGNLGGATHDWFASTGGYNDKLKAEVPTLNFQPMDPPADVNGVVKQQYSRTLLSGKGWGISSANKNPIETIKYFDFWFSEEGRRLNNFGLEGVHYDLVDGKPIFKESVLKGEKPVNVFLYEEGAQIEIGFQQDFTYEEQWMNPIAKAGVQSYVEKGLLMKQLPPISFTADEQKVLTEKWTAITTFIQESEQKWIMGANDVESTFDAYISSLKKMGMDDVVKIYNDAYQRYTTS